jgi:hypothetical protein
MSELGPWRAETHGAPGSTWTARLVWPLAIAEVVLILGVEWSAVWRRYFVNDDYQMLYSAWLRSRGKVPPADFGVQSYHLLPDLLAPVMRLLGAHIETALSIRLLFWCVLAAICVLTTRLTQRILDAACAPFALVLSLGTWPLLERGLDIRPDALSSALWLGCLLLAASPTRDGGPAGSARPDAPARLVAIGALLAVCVVLRPKSLLLVPAVVVLALHEQRAARGRLDPRTLAHSAILGALGFGTVASAFALYLHATRQWAYFFVGQQTLARLAIGASPEQGIRARAFALLLRTDPAFVALAGVGVLVVLVSCWRSPRRGHALTPHLAIVSLALAMVSLNPAFYAYNFVVLLPLLAPYAAAGCAALVRLAPTSLRGGASLLVLVCLLLAHGPLLVALATRETNTHQLALAKALAATHPDTTVFALEGIGLFRPSTYEWRFSAVARPLYRSGTIALRGQLEVSRPEIVILSYRVPGWLLPADQAWLARNYQLQTAELATLGAHSSGPEQPSVLQLARRAAYRVQAGPCEIDGVLRGEHETLVLGAGQHTLRATSDAQAGCRLQFHWPEAETLARPALPYLIFPDMAIYPVRS